MKPTRQVRPFLETLENRTTPSATVAVLSGSLMIGGATSDLTIEATSNTSYNVTHDGGVDAVTGVSGDIRVNMNATSQAENVTVDLKGFRLARDLIVNTGTGADNVVVKNGTVGRDVLVNVGGGPDVVTLGDGTSALTIGRDLSSRGGPFGNNSVTVKNKATIGDILTTVNEKKLVLEQGGTVARDLTYIGGNAGYDITIAGAVGGGVLFTAGAKAGMPASFTLASTGTVGQSVVGFTGAVFGFYAGSKETISLDGHIGGNVFLQFSGSTENVTFDTDLVVSGRAFVFLGGDVDNFTYNVPFTQPMTAYIMGGFGSNTFNGDANRPPTVVRANFRTINP